jgi:DNA polymerase-4
VKELSRRWILHLDMDAFFASVEQLDNPELRGKPVIIGGEERGVVSTASYEARRFGVKSAMPMFQAKRLCPQGIFLRGRMQRYKEKSLETMQVLAGFSPLVEQASVDEAYLDATGLESIFGSPQQMAATLQQAVLDATGLSCSIGLAPVKFLAKIASDMRKPGGLTVLSPEDVPEFLERLPVGKIPGVGKQMLKKLELLGVRMAADVRRFPLSFWCERLGKIGAVLYDRAGGIDPREIVSHYEPKSESAENTFAQDTMDVEILSAWLLKQAERVGRHLRKQGLRGRTITLKIKYADFAQHTRSRTIKERTNSTRVIYETALELLAEKKLDRPLRLIGLGVSQFGAEERQLELLPSADSELKERDAALDAALDTLSDKFGPGAVMRGKLFWGVKKTEKS